MPYQPKGSKVWWTSKPWRESTGTRDYAEALLYEQKLCIADAEGHAVPKKFRTHGQTVDQGIRLQDALDRWMVETDSVTTYHRELSAGVVATLGDVLIHNIDDATLSSMVMTLANQGNAASTINKKLRRVQVVLERAARVWKVKVQDIDFSMLRRKKAKVKHTFFLSHELEIRLLGHYRDNREFYEFLVVAIETGMRVGELLQLLWTDVDRAHSRIYVRDWAEGQSIKTGEIRSVPITGRCHEALRRIRTELCVPASEAKVFPWFKDKDQIRKLWQSAVDEFNLPVDKGATPRCTRRTCGTRLAEQGFSQAEIAAWLGHKSMASTEHYVNITSRRLDDMRKTVDNSKFTGRDDDSKTLSKNFESPATLNNKFPPNLLNLGGKPLALSLWEQDVGSSNLSTPTNSIVESVSYSFNIDLEEPSKG